MELTITVNPDGRLIIGGPIDDKVTCLGVLELAKQAIINRTPSAIQVIPAGVVLS